jgi:hypothetical protein
MRDAQGLNRHALRVTDDLILISYEIHYKKDGATMSLEKKC